MIPVPLLPPLLLVVLTALVTGRAFAEETLAIEGVTLVNVETGTLSPGVTVVVEGDRIAATLPTLGSAVAAARVVDGRGLFLMPGLFDAHVHYGMAPELYGAMMIANGVTAARDTGADTATIVAMRDDLAAGRRLGPELFVTGAIVDGDPPVWPFSAACDTPDEARAAVRELVAAGVDQVKVYSRLEREVWEAAVDEAHRHGVKAIGHVPTGQSVADALAVGQDGVEHLSGFDELIGRHVDAGRLEGRGEWSAFGYWRSYAQADHEALRAVYARLAEAGTVVCPTLVVMEGIGRAADAPSRDEAMASYVPAHLLSFWTGSQYAAMGTATRVAIPSMQAMVKELHRAGVTLVVGSDLANPFVHAGFAVHREMRLLQDAGIPAADVLRAATIAPARYLGVDDRLGTIQAGKTASMVLVRKNPLVDVAHAAEIEAVVARGELFDRAALDALLADARREASGGAGAGATGDDGPLAPPGELVARGRLKMSFSGFDAGVEEFAISRHDGGYRLQARSLPKGGFEQPFFIDFAFDGEGRFVEGVYRELVDEPLVASYAREGGTFEAFAQRGGRPLPPRSLEVGPDVMLDAPVFAGAIFSLHRLGLAPEEEREVDTIGAGRPTWSPVASTLAVTRLADEDLAVDGRAVRARRYAYAYRTPGGRIDVETWTDEAGVVLRATMSMPMGRLTAERADDGG